MEDTIPNQPAIPPIVQELSKQVNMTPIAWCIHPSFVVIVFEEGPKLTFSRTDVADSATPSLPDNSPLTPYGETLQEMTPIIHSPKSVSSSPKRHKKPS
jgi:hypothetical protein